MGNKNKEGLNPRRGASGITLLMFAAAFAVISVSLVSLKFSAKNGDSAGNFFGRTSAAISKTFGNIFSIEEKKPLLEFDLSDTAGAMAETSKEKNSGSLPNDFEKNVPLARAGKNISVFPANLASEDKKISGAAVAVKNFPPAENKIPPPASASPTAPPAELSRKKISECDFSKTGIPNHQIIFSEINWAGSKTSANDEWFEIKNNSGQDIGLEGWRILSGDENVEIIFGAGDKISSGNLYLLERSDDKSAPGAAADKIYSGALSNGGAHLKIFDPDCNLSDETGASKKWPAGDASARKTMERSFLDFSWHTSVSEGGTPKKENSAAFAVTEEKISFAQPGGPTEGQPADNSQPENNENIAQNTPIQNQNQNSSRILIAEIQITGGEGKTTNDFIRIFNPSANAFNLKGYRLVKRTKNGDSDTSLKSWTADAFVPAGGYYVWANSSLTGISPAPDITTSGSIANDNGIAIRQGAEDTGTIVDAVAWGAAQNVFIEGNVYPTNPGANQILSRKLISGIPQDTNNNANDFGIK